MNESSFPIRRAWLVIIVAVIAAVILASRLLASTDGVLLLYGRWDVVACSLIAALPLALLVISKMRIAGGVQKLFVACGLLIAAAVIAVVVQSIHSSDGLGVVSLTLYRWAIATLWMMAVMQICCVFVNELRLPAFMSRSWLTAAMLTAFALLVPTAYVDAVTDSVRIDLENNLDSRRYALAEQQARTIAELQPGDIINDKALTTLIPELHQAVTQMKAEVQRPLSVRPPIAEIGRRITLLMHLDRIEDALQLLNPLTRNPQFKPICLDYQGLCWQRNGEFSKSLAAYQNAVAYWNAQPESDRKRVSLVSAWKGIGFAARRLSERTLEEHAYRTLVDLSPTAESHFLLAQSYSEHQKTKLAAQHSAIAAQLDPKLKVQSESMLTSMSRDHFGCLQIP